MPMLHRAPQLSTRRKKGHYANEYWNPRVQQVQSQSQGSDAASTVGVASTVGPSASQVAPSTASTQKRIARVEIDIGQRIPTIGDPVPEVAPVIFPEPPPARCSLLRYRTQPEKRWAQRCSQAGCKTDGISKGCSQAG